MHKAQHMWRMPLTDNLLNPNHDKVTDYRKLFRLIGTCIAVDNTNRDSGNNGEVHLLLLIRENRLGLLTVHNGYDGTLPPMFCDPNHRSVLEFQETLEKATQWFETPHELLEYFGDEKHFKNPVCSKSPHLMVCFVREVMDTLKERYRNMP